MENAPGRVGEAGGGERKRKKTLGRQKIEIKKIECPEARHVCFSKRRFGLFKKASELCARTGAHLAIVVFSPAGKPYSFGHASVDDVIEGYLNPGSYAPPAGPPPHPLVPLEYEIELERLENAVQAEGRRRKALDAAARAAGVWAGGDGDLRGAGMPSLVARLAALERVKAEAEELLRLHEIFTKEAMMMQQCSALGSSNDDACFQFLQYPDAGTLAADGGDGGSSSYQQDQKAAMDMQMMLMGGNVVSHALPFAPMMMPADLPPPPLPVPQPFSCGSDDDNHFAGCEGYGYDLGVGGSNGAAYGMEGYYNGAVTTWDFFG